MKKLRNSSNYRKELKLIDNYTYIYFVMIKREIKNNWNEMSYTSVLPGAKVEQLLDSALDLRLPSISPS